MSQPLPKSGQCPSPHGYLLTDCGLLVEGSAPSETVNSCRRVEWRAAARDLPGAGLICTGWSAPNRIEREKGWSMSMGARDEPFAAFVTAYRARLLGTAVLIHLDPERAEALVDAVLAQRVRLVARLDDPYAVRAPGASSIPRRGGRPPAGSRRREFRAGGRRCSTDPVPAGDILAELAALSEDERRILVLASYTRLPLVDIASPARPRRSRRDRPTARRHGPATGHAAYTRTAAPHRRTARPPPTLPETETPADAPRAGRIARSATAGSSSLAVAAALLVVAGLGIRQIVPLLTPVASSAPAGRHEPVTRAARATRKDARCRAEIVSAWRSEMADVISSYLDPEWGLLHRLQLLLQRGRPGARASGAAAAGRSGSSCTGRRGGATEIYLQIATSRQYAIRCGQITKRECHTLRFMDGNRFTLTDPGTLTRDSRCNTARTRQYVITIVARNTSGPAASSPSPEPTWSPHRRQATSAAPALTPFPERSDGSTTGAP